MTRSPIEFAKLLNLALNRIKKVQTKKSLKKEIGDDIGSTADLIEYWQRGNCPATHDQAEITAKILWDKKGLEDRYEVELFLGYAGHPSPATVWNAWFVKIHGPHVDEDAVFIGREEKVAELSRVLKPRKVVLLWGPAGGGKTSVVAKVIETLAPNKTTPKQFPDGILYYDFYGQEHTADSALRYIADFFGIEVTKNLSPRDAASKALEGKHALIVLDSAHEAHDLNTILRISHYCAILIVSRYQHLYQSSETIFLDILPPNEAIAVLRAWSQDKKQPSAFQVWTNEREEFQIAHEICEALGRLPLALRLAGRYMLYPGVKPIQFLDLWRAWRLSLLQDGPHPQQHDSVQLLFEKSLTQVEEMSPGVGVVMAVAGLFSYQPFDTAAIAAALEIAESLVAKLLHDLWKFSLVIRVANERYQVVHRLIYTYAQSIHSSADITARLAAYYTKLAEEQSKLHVEGYKRLDAERAHIVATVTNCGMRRQWSEVHRLAWTIHLYLIRQWYWGDLEAVLLVALTAARSLQDRYTEGVCLIELGRIYFNKGERNKALEFYERAQQTLKPLGHTLGLANNHNNLGHVYFSKGEWDKASEFYQQALLIFEQLDSSRDLADTYNNLGNVYFNSHDLADSYNNLGIVYFVKGEWDKANEFYQQAQQRFEQLGDIHGLTVAYNNLGGVCLSKGEWDKANEFYQQAQQRFEQLGDIHGLTVAYNNFGNVYFRKGEWDKASEFYQQAQQRFEQLDSINDLVDTYNNLGNVYFRKGEWDKASEFYQQSLDTAQQLGDIHGLTAAYNNLGSVCFRKGEWGKASEFYQQALLVFEQLDSSRDLADSYNNLGNVYFVKGEWEKAIDFYQQSLAILERLGDIHAQAQTSTNLGALYARKGEGDKAIKFYQQAQQTFEQLGDNYSLARTCEVLADVYADLGHYKSVIEYLKQAEGLYDKIGDRRRKDRVLARLGNA